MEQFDVNYGVMWTVVSCVCKMWCDMECCNFRHSVMWNDVTWNMTEMPKHVMIYGMVWNVA